jgi:carboxypeptidase Taq
VRLIAALRRDQHKAIRVPTALPAAEMSSAGAHAQDAWLHARDARDFALFRPSLERVLDLAHRYAACFDGTGEFAHPYDVLLDDYEPRLTTAELSVLFARLRQELVPLVAASASGPERRAHASRPPRRAVSAPAAGRGA